MIKLLNAAKAQVALLTQIKDYMIESDLASGDKLLSFQTPRSHVSATNMLQEYFLLTATDEYVVKEVNFSDPYYYEVFAKLNLDDLRVTVFSVYEQSEVAVSVVIADVLTGTGWTYSMHDSITKSRTVTLKEVCAYDIIMECCAVYGCEVEFDTLDQVVTVYAARGADRGAYVATELNLKAIDYQSDSYEFCTRLYPYGKDGLDVTSVNGGLAYIDNNAYSAKVRELIWRDERYTVAQSLYDDAVIKLAAMAVPRISYAIDVLDIKSSRAEYSILDFRLGDTVKSFDSVNALIMSGRVVKLTEYPLTPEKNKLVFSNLQIKYSGSPQKAIDDTKRDIEDNKNELATAIDNATELITNGTDGYVLIRRDGNDRPYEILVMDTADIATAMKIWRWNSGGFGYSSSGYNGSYTTAITQDGAFVADFITTGTLAAALIKSGILQSADGSSWLNMDDGTFSFGDGRLALNAAGDLTLNYTGTALEAALAGKAAKTDLDTLTSYVRISGGAIYLGAAGSAVTLKIINDSIGFFQSDPVNPVAEFTDDTLTVTDANITKSIQIGNFAFVPRANGNLSFMKVVY